MPEIRSADSMRDHAAFAAPAEAPDWLCRLGMAAAESRRNLVLAGVFALAFLVAAVALAVVASGHTVQPFVLQASEEGAVVPASARLQPYRPGGAERRYFLAQWSRHLLALDARLSEGWLAEAYRLTRDKATAEFTEWLHRQAPLQRLKQDPTLTRSVEILGISMVDDEVALVRVALEERDLANPAARRRKQLLTVHYRTVVPDSEADVLRNPIGLQVTDFQVGEDLER